MQPGIRIGLIAGIVGLVLVVIGSAFSGICGSSIALLICAVAGFSSAQQKAGVSKKDGARAGAIAGAIASGIASHANILIRIILMALLKNSSAYGGFYIASDGFNNTERIFFYLVGLGWAVAVGGIVGAIAGYLGTPGQPGASSISKEQIKSPKSGDLP